MKAVLESSMQWSSFLWKMWQPAFEARSEAIVLQMAFAAAIALKPSFILTNSAATGTHKRCNSQHFPTEKCCGQLAKVGWLSDDERVETTWTPPHGRRVCVNLCVHTRLFTHAGEFFDERITTECLQYFEKQNRGLTVAAHAVQQVTESIRQIESDRQGF